MAVDTVDHGAYLEVNLKEGQVPTIGANGFLVRRQVLEETGVGDYLFDVDQVQRMVQLGYSTIAKVNIGIIHIFSGSFGTFVRKQRRRIRDYLYYRRTGERANTLSSQSRWRIPYFVLSTLNVVPLIAQGIRGYLKKPDRAWAFHVLACWTTLAVYSWEVVRSTAGVSPESRANWRGQ